MKPFSYDLFEVIRGKQLRHNFQGFETLERNYSECLQDIYVLSMTDGKREGTYLEIGCDLPFHRSNTAVLELAYGWRGLSIDYNSDSIQKHHQQRPNNTAYCLDATTIDYSVLLPHLQMPTVIDYLQLDCDPPDVTWKAMHRIPWDSYRFRVITYEHDSYYYKDKDFRKHSRKFLSERGYVLMAGNISPDEDRSRAFEDWWCDPKLIDPIIFLNMKSESDEHKKPYEYLLGHV